MRPLALANLAWFIPAGRAKPFDSLEEAIPQLTELPDPLVYDPVGGMEFRLCCLQAVKESYRLNSDSKELENVSPLDGQAPFLQVPPSEFPLNSSKFPCGAKYEDNKDGITSPVEVPYRWCNANCPGWQRSHNSEVNQWIQPFVGYILPAAVFALSVPRKRVLRIHDELFPNKIGEVIDEFATVGKSEGLFKPVKAFVVAFVSVLLIVGDIVVRAIIAAMIGFVDTLLWTALVFSAAGPMILSGLYEANVDRQVITYVEKETAGSEWNKSAKKLRKRIQLTPAAAPLDDRKLENGQAKPTAPRCTTSHKVHLLYAVLVGNLALPGTESPTSDAEPSLDAWSDIKRLLSPLRDSPAGPSKYELEITKSRLHTMLGSQARFGVTVAAALCFFLGSFLANVFGNLEDLGNNDTSHALAFGEWWMTIPFVAIVAGCLLAGNNPNTLAAIMSGADDGQLEKRLTVSTNGQSNDKPRLKLLSKEFFRTVVMPSLFQGIYQPVWMWERGRNKRRWIEKVQQENLPAPADGTPTKDFGHGWFKTRWAALKGQSKLVIMGLEPEPTPIPFTTITDWILIFFMVVALLLIPFTLAFLTSYYTPIIGLGCRSFTFVLYFLCQTILCVLWFIDFKGSWNTFATRQSPTGSPTGSLKGEGPDKTLEHDDRPIQSKGARWVFGAVFGLSAFMAVFSAIAGTFMQIVGVYRNCKCLVPIAHWANPDDFRVIISSNSKDDIRYAQLYWKNNGIAAIVLLAIVCYSGWWYQRHWRQRLFHCINNVIDEAKGPVQHGQEDGHPAMPKDTAARAGTKDAQPSGVRVEERAPPADGDLIKPVTTST